MTNLLEPVGVRPSATPDERVLALPILIAGERRLPAGPSVRINYPSGLTVELAEPSEADARRMVDVDPRPLRELSVDDLTIFFDRVRANWMAEDNQWRRMAIELGSAATGYSPRMTSSDADYLGHTLMRGKQYDFIETDLGDPALLDEWRPVKAILTRCWPKGVIAHIMVGNVPLASLFTIYRSLITKNVTVAKLPRRDVVTALCFANAIYDTDPDHPVTKALSVAYWQPESAVEETVLAAAEVVTAWGRGETMEALRRRLRPGAQFIEFGPKRSLAVVLSTTDLDKLAAKLAYDAVAYDQEACFSTQEIFVRGDARELGMRVARALESWQRHVPRRQLSVDADAHIQRARIEAVLDGWEVLASPGTDWTVVVTDGPTQIAEHPLSRFLFVHPIDSLDDVLSMIDRNVQTVSLEPWADVERIADELTAAGADRIVQAGRVSRFRPGFVHDGFHPMRQMVRWVSAERPIALKYRYTDVSPDEYDQRLYGPVFADLEGDRR